MAETTFVDFITMADAASAYLKLNNYSKIEYVQDLYYVGVICLESGELFKILRKDAYSSIMGYPANRKKKLLKLVDKTSTNEGFPFVYEQFLTEAIIADSKK